jgi:O-antigen/teichoic acid export membrane protein
LNKSRQDFFIIVVGRILQVVFALVSVRLTTTLLGPTQIGRVNLIVGVTSWFALLFISPVGNYVFRQALEWNMEGRLLGIVRRYAGFLGIVTVVAGIVVILIKSTIGIGTAIDLIWLLWLVAGTLFLGTLSATFITLINTLGHRGWYVLFANLTTWLGLGLAVAITSWTGHQAEYWMTGLLIGQIIVMLLSVVVIYRVARRPSNVIVQSGKTRGFDVSSVFRFSWPLIIATGFYWIQNSGYVFLLVKLSNEASVGLLVAGLAIAVSPLVMFESLFTEYYRPIFYRDISYSDNTQKAQAWNRYASAYFPAIVLVAVFMALSGPWLARLLVSESFQKVSWLAVWGALIQSALMVYATYITLVFASLNTRIVIWPNVFGAVVVVVGMVLLVPLNPLLGSGIALALGMFVTMIDLARRLRHRFVLHLPWRRIVKAGLISLPMFIGFEVVSKVWTEPTLPETLATLAVGGIYMLAGQYLLARSWLFQRSKLATPDRIATALQSTDA